MAESEFYKWTVHDIEGHALGGIVADDYSTAWSLARNRYGSEAKTLDNPRNLKDVVENLKYHISLASSHIHNPGMFTSYEYDRRMRMECDLKAYEHILKHGKTV